MNPRAGSVRSGGSRPLGFYTDHIIPIIIVSVASLASGGRKCFRSSQGTKVYT